MSANSYPALDPRVAYLMTSMLEEVMRSGTAAGARARGFTLPAAGKTGTSHDGWFAGYTSRLLCIVWVGFDDYTELNLEGAKSALPIWTEFMKRASKFASYRDAKEFAAPGGIVSATICVNSGKLAGDLCVDTRNEQFIAGTDPRERCDGAHDSDFMFNSGNMVDPGGNMFYGDPSIQFAVAPPTQARRAASSGPADRTVSPAPLATGTAGNTDAPR